VIAMNQRHILMGYLCGLTLFSACTEPSDESDFGAAVVARYIVNAEHQCSGINIDGIVACANSSSRSKARLSAQTANEALEIFNMNCRADLDTSRCDGLLFEAYCRIRSVAPTP